MVSPLDNHECSLFGFKKAISRGKGGGAIRESKRGEGLLAERRKVFSKRSGWQKFDLRKKGDKERRKANSLRFKLPKHKETETFKGGKAAFFHFEGSVP